MPVARYAKERHTWTSFLRCWAFSLLKTCTDKPGTFSSPWHDEHLHKCCLSLDALSSAYIKQLYAPLREILLGMMSLCAALQCSPGP